MRRSVALQALVWSLATLPTSLVAQQTISARAATLTWGGRLHAQYQASSVDGAEEDFFIRRARINLDIDVDDFVSGRLLTDLAGGEAALLDAYVELQFDPRLRLAVGQFKRAFDLFELASTTDLSIIERDGRVAGYTACTGVGSICSFSRLSEELAYSGRDAGVRAAGAFGRVGYQATLTNGAGVGVRDDNDGKSFSGRVTLGAGEAVTLAANVGVHDWVDPVDETRHALAWGGDVQVGDWRDGLLVQAGLMAGDNWMSLAVPGLDPGRFVTVQAVATYYHALEGARLAGVEPIARVSWADPDGDVDDDGGTLLTPGLMVYFVGRNRIGVNLDSYIPGTGDAVHSLKVQAFLYF